MTDTQANARSGPPGADAIPAWEGDTLRPLPKLEVHRRGLRHKAVSVFVNAGGETLLQKRALTKYHTPGLWSNACCTHPHWGEEPAACARRRLGEELGLDAAGLAHRGRVVYRADVGQGLVEHEEVEIFTLDLPGRVEAPYNPGEVAAVRWASFAALEREVGATPAAFTPWLAIYLRHHGPLLRDRATGS